MTKNTYYSNWDFAKINSWINEHISIQNRFAYNYDNGYKKIYSDGSTYEFKFTKYTIREKCVEIRINNELVMSSVSN